MRVDQSRRSGRGADGSAPAPRRLPRTRRLLATGAFPLAAAVAAPLAAGSVPALIPEAVAAPSESVPEGVKVTGVDWVTPRRVEIMVHSAAMNEDIKVQILVARDWHLDEDTSFPEVLMLDGLRAEEHESGWTINTDIVDYMANKNVNVVLPVGGESSFYTDWNEPDNGKNYQWETFLTEELQPILQKEWRTDTDNAAIAGLSMGGTAAVMLAERHPDMFKFVGSYSGILSTTSFGMPQALQFAMLDAGGFHSEKMWGPPSSERWQEQDPLRHVDKLDGTQLYVSSGSGAEGEFDDPSGIPGVSNNVAGMGLEILSRLTTRNFASAVEDEDIDADVVYRPTGTHSWPYWQFELHQSWPLIAGALGVEDDDDDCSTSGAIGDLADRVDWLGSCVGPERDVDGGRAQDFTAGTVYWSPETDAHLVAGAIGGRYGQLGGSGGSLGLPVTNEKATPDGEGRFNHFEHGSIYWMPETGAHSISGPVMDKWSELGWEAGELGYPVSEPESLSGGAGEVQEFQNGAIYTTDDGVYAVQGQIMDKYRDLDDTKGVLGMPTSDEIVLPERDGRLTTFTDGAIYWTPGLGAAAVEHGPIFDAWEDEDFENGRLGFPVGEKKSTSDGEEQEFEHGTITYEDGRAGVHADD